MVKLVLYHNLCNLSVSFVLLIDFFTSVGMTLHSRLGLCGLKQPLSELNSLFFDHRNDTLEGSMVFAEVMIIRLVKT